MSGHAGTAPRRFFGQDFGANLPLEGLKSMENHQNNVIKLQLLGFLLCYYTTVYSLVTSTPA